MSSEKKENSSRVVFIGVILIIFVAVFTVARPYIFQKKTTQNISSSATNQKDTSLEISSADLWQKINSKENIKIVDIRDQDSFTASHIIDAQNLPSGNINTLDKNQAYVLVDESGDAETEKIAVTMKSAGMNNVKFLTGGMANWRNENRPTIFDGDPTSFTDQAKVRYITADDLKKGLEKSPNVLIVDLRKSSAFAEGHIKDSINIFLGDLEAERKRIPAGKQLILVDNDGLWAFKGAVRLFDMGFMDALVLSDGLDKWKEKGYEIAK